MLAPPLPATERARHWPTAWIGLDVLLALGSAATALLLVRRDARAKLTAAATATAATLDVWFDVTTSAAGAPVAEALACGSFELVLAAGLVAIALGALDRRPGRRPVRDPGGVRPTRDRGAGRMVAAGSRS